MNLPVVNLIRSLAITVGTAGLVGASVTSCPDNPGALLQASCGNGFCRRSRRWSACSQ